MPRHFFFTAFAVHHETAIRADVEKQNYSVCPRHWYVDADFKCERCGQKFTWSSEEQKVWFEEYFFWVDSQPRHCRPCRGELRRLFDLRKEYDATVAAARNHGTTAQKCRIVEIVSELEDTFRDLPTKMIETKERFQHQITKRAEAGAAPDGGPATSVENQNAAGGPPSVS